MYAPSYSLLAAVKIRQFFAANRGFLPMIVIYDNPRDDPGTFIARVWTAGPGPEPTATKLHLRYETFETMQQAIDALGLSLAWLPRQPMDDPTIVGVWI